MESDYGLETCSRCNGKKYESFDDGNTPKIISIKIGGFEFNKPTCKKCKGIGKVRWIDNLFHTEDEDLIYHDWMINFTRYQTYPQKKNWKHWSDKSKYVKYRRNICV